MSDLTTNQPVRSSWLPNFIFTAAMVAVVATGLWQRQNIIDWYELRGYTAPAAVSQLASEDTMTDKARRIFYVNHPEIQDKQPFYSSCGGTETAVVLGCYKSPDGIFLLQVTDQRLNGVEQVTAAHEMLHAAYARLSTNQKKQVDAMIAETYSTITDPLITGKIDEYKKEGADTTNELHSILATEVANLPTDLENYYKQYFTNRRQITAYNAAYESEFTARKDKVDALDAQLKSIQDQVSRNNSTLLSEQSSIDAESKRLDQLLKSGDITDYNAGVQAYNASLVPFRQLLADTKKLVANYKTLLDQRNAIAEEAQELSRALDSSVQTTVTNK